MTLFTFYKRVPFSSTQAPSVTARGSMTSRSISHYRLIKKLGAGGMGEVYLAKDARLDREVAIKLLSSQATSDEHARKRLIREAKAAAKLDHPNICSVYAVEEQGDQSFIVMQYVEGETLASRIQRQPLALKEALHIAVQMADALAEAHSRAIIHRDIKPANMMLTARGQLKVMDFGLAKVVPEKPVAVSEVPTESLLTEPGMIIGTVPYMSPEQVRGEPLDPRTDIFSFGAVLYELISGRRPFAAEDRATILSAILTQEPLPLARYAPDTPDELQRIVRKCLVKNREHRYQSARDLLIDLKNLQEDGESAFRPARQAAPQRRGKAYRIAIVAIAIVILALARLAVDRLTAPTRAIDSIAVLPFENRSPDADTEYLSDGLAESLIYRLSQLPDLKVSPTSSAFRYKGKGADAQTVGNDLGVQAVMTGRIAQRGEQLTISVELVEVRNNKLLWGEQYERKLSELLAMQREMAAEITDKLRLKLSGEGERKLAKTYTDNNEAYQLYLKGRYFWDKRTPEGMDKARQSFNQAIDIDPNYALAYAGLADTFLFCTCPLPRDETMPKARAYAERALAIDESLAEAHTSLGFVKMNYEFDWRGAERELERAIELNPSYPIAHQFYGGCLLQQGRVEEGLQEVKRSLGLDPLSLALNWYWGMTLSYARRYDEAIEQLRKTIQMEPNYFLAHSGLGGAYLQKRLYAEAISEFQTAAKLRPGTDEATSLLAYAYAVSGNRREAQRKLDELKGMPASSDNNNRPLQIAKVYAALGDKDQAIEWLEKAYERRAFGMFFLKVDPGFDTLRSDERFKEWLRRIGLTP